MTPKTDEGDSRMENSKELRQVLAEVDQRLQCVLDQVVEYYWELDKNRRFSFIRYSRNAIAQKDPGYFIGKTFRELGEASLSSTITWNKFDALFAERQPIRDFVTWYTDPDLGMRYSSISGQPFFDETGSFTGYRGTVRDVTAEQENESFASSFELAAVGIAHVGASGKFIHANRKLCEMLGYTKEEILKLTIRQISHPDDERITDEIRAKLRSGEIEFFKIEKRYLHKNGTPIWAALTIAVKRDPNGEALYDVSVVEDITARKAAEDQVQYLATHDGMTGLPNRSLFSQLVKNAIEYSSRYKHTFAVLFIDLDRFKQINDSLGHEAGDILLKTVAHRFRNCLRSSDVVARLGGDEFVVLAQRVSNQNQVIVVARNLLAAAMKPIPIMGHECRVTASIGISMYPQDGKDEQTMMMNADLAMYLAKEEGKNNFQFYSPDIKSHSVEKMLLESHLRSALELNEFTVHYQAKVNIQSGEIKGVEALLRWTNPVLGAVSPTQFIPMTEEMGLIIPIGRWVLLMACQQNLIWQKEGLQPICISVNLSPRQFADNELIPYIKEILAMTGMAPNLLELEITESIVMHNTEKTIQKLMELKAMGIRIAIDDFGTGYSSLSQLKKFPVDTLKVDRSFIREIALHEEDRAITQAIIAMGKTLGLTVVAEGVESAEQLSFLSNNACDEMQGFYFNKPISPEELSKLMHDHVPIPREKG
jgi:diguanylate cyclase (GGDEF)-like protein/PAS domain S-box-containing protein